MVDYETLPSERERFEYAESLIKKYAAALLVVTSRLHCALPCLGLETPVIFIAEDLQDKRLGGIKELFSDNTVFLRLPYK
ncbi:MAG: polysaccharide pyruvyl transferase family protein [Treponema sp.]|jgi:exopolysaccharide biosynthesis predicted pyruvyltransferase EpsI|nr:polysaccharide pyruvyl transferase family protein [Treponema sp.]